MMGGIKSLRDRMILEHHACFSSWRGPRGLEMLLRASHCNFASRDPRCVLELSTYRRQVSGPSELGGALKVFAIIFASG